MTRDYEPWQGLLRLALFFVALMAFLIVAVPARSTTLLFTLPSQHATVIDTTYFDCGGGPTLTTLDSVRVFMWPITGGGWRQVASEEVRGQEGMPYSIEAPTGGHFYVVATTILGGISCASNVVSDLGPITGVPDWSPKSGDREQVFDVQGRLRRPPLPSGVYFRRVYHQDGRVRITKFVVLK